MGRPRALVYRGESTEGDDDLAEPIVHMLKKSPYNFQVDYCGPNEDIDLDEDGLEGVSLFAMPGGPDLENAYEELKESEHDLKQWVRNGGRYLGICLGVYLCGHNPGFGLLPHGCDTDSECTQHGAQVTNDKDDIIQIDWTFSWGERAGQTHKDQWIYYQEGPCINNFQESEDAFVLARYSKSGRIAGTLNAYGRGWVGAIGPHPEADQSWFDEYDLPTPQGLRFDIGYDLITSLMEGRCVRQQGSQVVEAAPTRGYGGGVGSKKKQDEDDDDDDDEDDEDDDEDDDDDDDDDDEEDDDDDDDEDEDEDEERGPRKYVNKAKKLMKRHRGE